MCSFYAYLLLGVCIQIAISQNVPAITYISPKQVGYIESSVDLQCSASNAEDIPLLWAKIGGEYPLYISSGSALVVPDSRYSIRHNFTSRTFTLKINNLQLSDAGLYQCILAIARDKRITSDVELEVHQQTV